MPGAPLLRRILPWTAVALTGRGAAAPVNRSLAAELLALEPTGDLARGERLLGTYGRATPEIRATIGRLTGIPVDIAPVFHGRRRGKRLTDRRLRLASCSQRSSGGDK